MDDRPKARGDVSERLVAGERVVLDPETNQLHQLNVTAAVVWELCDGERTIREIAAELQARFEVDEEQALADTTALIDSLRGLGLLEPAS